MKKLIIGFGLMIAAFAAAAQVSVSVGTEISPGVYGRINIGDERPTVVYTRPQIIVRDRSYVKEPIYLYVPPQHQRRWRKYCYYYNACNRPVFFVEDSWVRERYEKHRDNHVDDQHREWRDGRWQDRNDRWQERDDRWQGRDKLAEPNRR